LNTETVCDVIAENSEHTRIAKNLKENCNGAVSVFIVYFYAKCKDHNLKFSSNVGANLGFIETKYFNSSMFAGYLGFGKYKNELLSSQKVQNYIENKQLLRLDFTDVLAEFDGRDKVFENGFYSSGVVKIHPYNYKDTNNITTINKLYYCKKMQYNKNSTKGLKSIFENFSVIVESYVSVIVDTMDTEVKLDEINYINIEALEIILPEKKECSVAVLAARLLAESLDEYFNDNIAHKNYTDDDFYEMYKSISNQLSGYENITVNEDIVARWIGQFEISANNKYKILDELNHILKKFYFSKDKIYRILEDLLVNNKYEIFPNGVEDVTFLDAEQKGCSQKRLLEIANCIVEENFGLRIDKCHSKKRYLYIDDCIFTGSTLKTNLTDCINSISENSTVYIFTIALHDKNFEYVQNELKKIGNEKKIEFVFKYAKKIHSKPSTNNIEVLRPKFIENKHVASYICFLKGIKHKKRLYYDSKTIYRKNEIEKDQLFNDSKNRDILEKYFTIYGSRIINEYFKNNGEKDTSIRPLGFETLITLGFGSMFMTYRNIANCCPLVLWVENEYWKPLIPRKVNFS